MARRADGRLVPLLVSAAPIRGEHGELVGATMIFQDVSTLKELEHLREEWASIVAHDLQQPISVIVLRSDLLLAGRPQPASRQDDVREVRKRRQAPQSNGERSRWMRRSSRRGVCRSPSTGWTWPARARRRRAGSWCRAAHRDSNTAE